MPLEIEIVPCLSDNYAYLVKSGGQCAVVDPSEPEPVRAALAKKGWTLTHILNTHHHLDHCGGNLALKEETGATIVGPAVIAEDETSTFVSTNFDAHIDGAGSIVMERKAA